MRGNMMIGNNRAGRAQFKAVTNTAEGFEPFLLDGDRITAFAELNRQSAHGATLVPQTGRNKPAGARRLSVSAHLKSQPRGGGEGEKVEFAEEQ